MQKSECKYIVVTTAGFYTTGIVLQTCQLKIVFWTRKFAVGLIDSEVQLPYASVICNHVTAALHLGCRYGGKSNHGPTFLWLLLQAQQPLTTD